MSAARTAFLPRTITFPRVRVSALRCPGLSCSSSHRRIPQNISDELVAKRLELLRELVPAASRVAVLPNPANAGTMLQDVEAAARRMGVQIQALNVSTSHDIEAAFAALGRDRPDALFVTGGPLLQSRRMQLALLSARHAIPTMGRASIPKSAG
jgi:ABC-type uncharacterized transport system substrate-binding protein